MIGQVMNTCNLMQEAEVSPRFLLTKRILDHCKRSGILPEHSEIFYAHDAKNRKFYFFWLPQNDFHNNKIAIRVYGEKSIMIVSDSQFPEYINRSEKHSFIFKREEHLLKFLDAAYVFQDIECLKIALENSH